MIKGKISEDAKRKLEDELTEMAIIHDYLSKTNQKEAEFVSIRNKKEMIFLDGQIRVPKILMMENSNGITELLKKHTTQIENSKIESTSKSTGLERKDIMLLLNDGMELNEIEKKANELPFKDIAESSAIREMIRRDINPNQLNLMRQKGVQIIPNSDGSITINSLEKFAKIDENGLMIIEDEQFSKSLELYAQTGYLKLSDELVVQDLDDEKKLPGTLKVVSLKEKEEQQSKEEKEKLEIANAIGEDPEDIISIIRIEDRDGGSKLFNYDIEGTSKPIIVRLKNSNFKLMEEKADGKKEELQGYKVTPVAKEVAHLLKDTQGNLVTNLKPGEVRAGKTNPDQEKYNLFQIRKAGESKDNDSNQLLYVNAFGKTDMNFIESKDNGDVMFDEVPKSSIYPKNVYIQSSSGTMKEKNVTHENKECETKNNISFKDIEKRKELLKRLMEVEDKINEIDEDEKDISDELSSEKGKLSDLYSQRGELLRKLGINEREIEREEEMEIFRGKRPI